MLSILQSKFFPVRRTTAQEHYSPESIHYSPDSRPSIASSSGSVNEQSSLGIPSSPVNEKPQMCRRERKMARMDTHTNYTLVSQSLQAKKKADSTGTLYKIFQECLKVSFLQIPVVDFKYIFIAVVETAYIYT